MKIKFVSTFFVLVFLLSSSAFAAFDRPLTTGDRGDDVTLLQRLLNTAGFTVAPPPEAGSPCNETSYYGQLTATAIKTLQCEKAIVCDGTPETTGFGTVGPKTLTLLNSLLSEFKGLTLNLQKGQTLDLQGRTLIDPRSQLAQIAPTSNLVAHYTFDEGSGTTAGDSSGNGNTGTLTPTTGGPTWVTGADVKVGSGAISFDGVNDEINLDNLTNFDFSQENQFTISTWLFPGVSNASDNIFTISYSFY